MEFTKTSNGGSNILYKHFIKNPWISRHLDRKKVEENDNSLYIYCHLMRKPHKCRC